MFVALLMASGLAGAGDFAVFKSMDQGRSWTRSDAGLPRRSRINAFGRSENTILAGTDSGIFVSSDAARTWSAARVPASSRRVISFAKSGPKVFAGTDGGGLLASSNDGEAWTSVAFDSKKVRSLVAHGGNVYAGTDADGVFVSSTDGEIWKQLQAGWPEHAQVFALMVVKDGLFAGLYGKGLYRWSEQEQRWTKIGRVTPLVLASAGETLIVGHNPGGLHWSDDGGVSWARGKVGGDRWPMPHASGELSDEAPVWEAAADDKLAVAGAASGIFYSADHGRTWTRARAGLPPSSPGVAFLVGSDFVLAGVVIDESKRDL